MIRVLIQMCPLGDETRPRELGRMYIANDGVASRQDSALGSYTVGVCRKGSDAVPFPVNPGGPQPTRAGRVENYPRLSYNIWRLIARAALSCFPEEATIKLLGDVAALQDLAALSEPSDEDALELGRELLGRDAGADGWTDANALCIGRNAWLRGARPRGW